MDFFFYVSSDYFEKQAKVITCEILSNDPKCAIIEFDNEKIVEKLLERPIININGINLSLSINKISECAWSSPPRNITNNILLIDQANGSLLSNSCKTTVNNLDKVKFIEQYQNEIDQISDEFMIKFTKDRKYIEYEIHQLIKDEQVALNKIQQYLSDHRQHRKDSVNYKRKHSSTYFSK